VDDAALEFPEGVEPVALAMPFWIEVDRKVSAAPTLPTILSPSLASAVSPGSLAIA
jgi:hypothetical protein